MSPSPSSPERRPGGRGLLRRGLLRRRRRLLWRLPALLIMGAIWFLSSQSTLPKPKGILGFDKFQHLAAFGALAFSFGFWFSKESRRLLSRRFLFLTVTLSALYGVIDEIHQYFVPGRNCNVWDWIADALGAVLGTALAAAAARLGGGRGSPR